MDNQKLHSSHLFIFPFRWFFSGSEDWKKKRKIELVRQHIDKNFWRPFKFQIKNYNAYNTYNEYAYFYPQVRDILGLDHGKNSTDVLRYEYKLNGNEQYVISLKEGKTYTLDIEDILVSFFPDGIGVFVFVLNNNKHASPDDILKINDYGRRIFPQFLSTEEPMTDKTKGSFLADSIELKNLSTAFGNMVFEDFSYYDSLENLRKKPFVLPAHIGKLLGKAFCDDLRYQPLIETEPVLDDRMFVLSMYFNGGLMRELSRWDYGTNHYVYETDDFWYKYIFVDGKDKSSKSKTFTQKLLKASTYDRWIGQHGHLYGMSRYSFVVLAADNWFTRNVILMHIKFLYFQMIKLALVQRAYLVHFGMKVARISAKIKTGTSSLKYYREHIGQLYLDYIKFINRIYFREITAQEQGIELYDMLQEKMRIERDVKDLDREIQELNEFLETQETASLNRFAHWFLPAALIAGVLGMNTMPEKWIISSKPYWPFWISMAVVVLTVFIMYWKNKPKRNKL